MAYAAAQADAHQTGGPTGGETIGTILTEVDFRGMSADEAKRFRARAQDCRRLSKDARDALDRKALADMAEELDAEADMIERAGTDATPTDEAE